MSEGANRCCPDTKILVLALDRLHRQPPVEDQKGGASTHDQAHNHRLGDCKRKSEHSFQVSDDSRNRFWVAVPGLAAFTRKPGATTWLVSQSGGHPEQQPSRTPFNPHGPPTLIPFRSLSPQLKESNAVQWKSLTEKKRSVS